MAHHHLAGFLDLGKAFLPDRSLATVASHQGSQGSHIHLNSKANHQSRLQLVLVRTSNPPLLQRKQLRSNLSLRA
jgi:hypothetical protein